MALNSNVPSGPLAQKWDRHQIRSEARQPGEQAEVRRHRRGHGSGRRLGRSDAGGAGLQGESVLFSGQPAPRAQHRRARRHQCGEKLSERRRFDLPAFLRHDQRRRFPRARSERLSPRASQREHHRPMRGARRAVCARVRRFAGESFLRRRAGFANFLRARPNRPAACSSARIRRSAGKSARAMCKCFRAPRCSISSSSTVTRKASSFATW